MPAIARRHACGVDLAHNDIDRVKSHLAKYYAKMDDTAPWERE